MTATATRVNIITRLRQDGRLADALEELLGTKIARDKTTALRCLEHAAHSGGDAHPSMVVKPRAGRVACPACGLDEGLLDLAVRAGHGRDRAKAAAWLERRWYGAAKTRKPRSGKGKKAHAPSTAPAPASSDAPPDETPDAPTTRGPAVGPHRGRDYPTWCNEARERLVTMRRDAVIGPAIDAWGAEALDALGVGYLPKSPKRAASFLFPVEDALGHAVGVKIRALTPPPDGVKSRSVGPVGTGLVGGRQLAAMKEAPVVVAAGEKDVLLGKAAVPEFVWVAVASGEGASLTDFQLRMLGGREVVVLYDLDEVGAEGAKRVARELAPRAKSVAVATLPDDVLDGTKAEKDVADLCRKLGPAAGDALRQIVADAVPVPRPRRRPHVIVRQQLTAVTDRAEECLAADEDSGLYARSGLLVRVVRSQGTKPKKRKKGAVRRPAGAPVIEAASPAHVREQLDRVARWSREVIMTEGTALKDTLPPQWVVETLMSRGTWPLPELTGVVEAPTLREDGTVLAEPGYDAETGLLFEPSAEFPPVPDAPTADEVRSALVLLQDPFTDFPFVAQSDRAAAVASVLTVIGRGAIDGPAPMVAVRAPTPGTGKTLVVDIVSLIATGRPAARMTVGRDDSETRKLILSIGIEGGGVTLIDNIEGSLGSPALAAALTSTTFRDRLLGASKLVTVSLKGTTWFTTGNGLVFKGDLGRRVLPIDLDAGVEHPEDRDGFKHTDVLGFVRQERHRLVAAALTVLRAYHVAGRPSHGLPRVGSFEEWDDLIRGACIWSGLGDPVAGRQRIREESDQDLDTLREAVGAWRGVFGTQSVTLPAAIERAGTDVELRAALAGLVRGGIERLDSRTLGYALRRLKGRIVGGLRFEHAGRTGGKVRWRVGGPAVQDGGEGNGSLSASSAQPPATDGGGSCCAA